MRRLLAVMGLVGLGLLVWWPLQDGDQPPAPERETSSPLVTPGVVGEESPVPATPAAPPTVPAALSPSEDPPSGPGRVTGRVLSAADHQPVSGVWVHAESIPQIGAPAWESDTRTDEDGRYMFDGIGPGEIRVCAHGGGWVSTSLGQWLGAAGTPPPLRVSPGEVVTQDIEVERTGRLVVTVLTATGEPEEGLYLVASSGTPGGYTTECHSGSAIDGKYRFTNLVPGFAYEMRCMMSMRGVGEPVRVQAGETARILVRMPEELWIQVEVVDAASGTPIGEARLSALCPDQSIVANGNSAPDGGARLGPLVAGDCEIQARAKGYVSERIEVELPVAGPIRVELVRSLAISGRVILTGEGVGYLSTLWVLVRRMVGPAWDTLESGARGTSVPTDGTFRISGLRPGTYQLEVICTRTGQKPARILVDAGATDIQIEIDEVPKPGPHQVLLAKLLGPDGKPVRQARCLLHPPSALQSPMINNGILAVRTIAGMPVHLEIHDAIGADGKALGAEEFGPFTPPCEIELHLSPERRVTGMVVDAAGRPVSHVVVRAIPDPPDPPDPPEAPESLREDRLSPRKGMHHATAVSGRDGRFILGGLGVGPYLLLVEPPTRFAKIDPVRLAAGVTNVSIALGPDPR